MKKKTSSVINVYIIPHSHVDVEWYYNQEEGRKRAVMIINEALKCMEKSSAFTFAQDNIVLFPHLLENLPNEKIRLLKEKIRQNKFEITGGMWTQPEEAEPAGEVLIRNILIGKKWVKEHFGMGVETAWQIDNFGHIPQLPQILKKAGYKHLAFYRGVPPKIAEIIPNLFWGKSPDGSKILTLWMNKSYVSPWSNVVPQSVNLRYTLFYKYRYQPPAEKIVFRNIKARLKELFQKSPGNYIFLPAGNDNSIPQEEINFLPNKLNDRLPGYNFFFSTPARFFKERMNDRLAEINFDFPLPFYFQDLRGTWESRCDLKRAFRIYENTLLSAEKFSTIACLEGNNYPAMEINLAWKDAVVTSYHDNIGGSHGDEVEEASLRRLGMKKDTGMINELPEYVLGNALKHLGRKIKDGVIVFNPHSFPATDIVHVAGRAFLARAVPPLGFKTYRISKARHNSIKVGKNYLENGYYRLEFTPRGGIRRILDKRTGKELINSSLYCGNELIAISHDGDLEGMLNLKREVWRDSREKFLSRENKANVLSSLSFKSRTRMGDVEKTVCLYEDLPRIDFKTVIDLKKTGILLKVRFPLMMRHFKTFYSTQFAVVEREQGHFPAYDWVACEASRGNPPQTNQVFARLGGASGEAWAEPSGALAKKGEDGNSGVGLINTGNIGYWVGKNFLDLVLLWSVEQTFPKKTYTAPSARELGAHTFTYSLLPYQGRWQDNNLIKEGLLLNAPLIPRVRQNLLINQAAADLTAVKERSFLRVDPEDFIISSFKKSEDGKGFVLRGYESRGEKGEVRISFDFSVKGVWLCNLLEEKERELPVRNNSVTFHCNGFEIVSLYLKIAQ